MLSRAICSTTRASRSFCPLTSSRVFASNDFPRSLYEKSYDTSPLFADRVPIYRLRQIFGCAVVNRLKRYQLLMTGTVVPFSWASHFAGFFDAQSAICITASSLLCTGLWFAIGNVFVNLIGFIYVGQTNHKRITVSYLDFWGNRIDRDLKPEEIDTSGLSETKYISVLKTSQFPYKLKITLRFGEVVEPFWFDRYFYDETHRGKPTE